MSSKGRPYRTVTIDGYQVLIGRGERENDELTFRVAEPHDLWLHVGGGTPGSHVVIQNPERGDVPRDVIEKAAALAAWYSRARNASRVEVHVCRAADVSKPRGAPPGLVQIQREKRLKVRPAQLAAAERDAED
jgi:predicted ribosome quality control (RQC) complex YloA/Tae2 family protein